METLTTEEAQEKETGKLIRINEEEVKSQLNQLVIRTVEEMLNGLAGRRSGQFAGSWAV